MWTQISAIATYIGSYPFRGAVRTEPGGVIAVVQLKDAGSSDDLGPAIPRVANQDGKYDRYLLQPGDVLVQARSTRRHLAGLVHLQEPAIAAPGLHALRPNPGSLTSAYLTWCLNHPKTQAAIAAVAQGTHAPLLSKQALMDLRIPLPSPLEQQRIADVITTREHERQLVARLEARKDELLNARTWDAATSGIEKDR